MEALVQNSAASGQLAFLEMPNDRCGRCAALDELICQQLGIQALPTSTDDLDDSTLLGSEKYAFWTKSLLAAPGQPPSALELAHMANLEYYIDRENTACLHRISGDERAGVAVDAMVRFLEGQHWKLDRVHYARGKRIGVFFKAVLGLLGMSSQGFWCTSFINYPKGQFVLLFRGTQTTSHIVADIKMVLRSRVKDLMRLTNWNVMHRKMLEHNFLVTIAGHSLGGLMAQMAYLHTQYPQSPDDNIHSWGLGGGFTNLRCVSFDSPGVSVAADDFEISEEDRRDLSARMISFAGMTSYLSNYNPVNLLYMNFCGVRRRIDVLAGGAPNLWHPSTWSLNPTTWDINPFNWNFSRSTWSGLNPLPWIWARTNPFALHSMENILLYFIKEDRLNALVEEDHDEGMRPLHIAAKAGNTFLAGWLLQSGADINEADASGRTPLYWACANGHFRAAEFLIERGANVNTARNDGHTPLHAAMRSSHYITARVLIKGGADVSVVDVAGFLSQGDAAGSRHRAHLVNLLLDNLRRQDWAAYNAIRHGQYGQ